MRGEGIWKVVAVVVATALVVGAWGYLLTTWPPDPPGSAVATAPGAAPGAQSGTQSGAGPSGEASGSSSPSPGGTGEEQTTPTAVVLGDSFSAGTPGVAGAPWPEVLGKDLGWDVVTDAAQGSGYLVAGSGLAVPDRVQQTLERAPDVVVVAAGVSDLSRPADDIVAAAEETVVGLRDGLPEGEVVLLSPFSDGPAGELTTALAVRLEEVAAEQGVAYVDVTDLLPRDQGLLAADGVHPSEAGHRQIAEALAAELTELGVDDAPAAG